MRTVAWLLLLRDAAQARERQRLAGCGRHSTQVRTQVRTRTQMITPTNAQIDNDNSRGTS